MVKKEKIIRDCHALISAYKNGSLGQTVMPEDSHPDFKDQEQRLVYFTLPMALNYQRNSYKLWEAALKTCNDKETCFIFDIEKSAKADKETLRKALTKHKLALQPNKHIETWKKISETIYKNWGKVTEMMSVTKEDFRQLKQLITVDNKKGFPYLSGPKIFNYWSFIISTYGKIPLKNRDLIEIAPDTHITQCSIKLEVITEEEASALSKEEISARWRDILAGSGIDPIDMHPPLWFWSRNKFIFNLS